MNMPNAQRNAARIAVLRRSRAAGRIAATRRDAGQSAPAMLIPMPPGERTRQAESSPRSRFPPHPARPRGRPPPRPPSFHNRPPADVCAPRLRIRPPVQPTHATSPTHAGLWFPNRQGADYGVRATPLPDRHRRSAEVNVLPGKLQHPLHTRAVQFQDRRHKLLSGFAAFCVGYRCHSKHQSFNALREFLLRRRHGD